MISLRTMSSEMMEDEVEATTASELLTGEYHFEGMVGEGAMGQVLEARDLDLQRLVAYKQMSEEIASQPALASKFYGEAQITAQLDHPNVVPVYALEQTKDGMLAYTMKLIDGRTIEDLIDECREAYQGSKNPTLTDQQSLEGRLEMFMRVCEAMHYAHSRGVIHRDLKPENVMIGAYGEVYVMDWGIAKVLKNADIPEDKRIHLMVEPEDEGDLVIGTPQYLSPEQAYGLNDELDHLSDQYSMGLILYELVSLNVAVTGKTATKIVMRQQDGEKDPIKHVAGLKIDKALKAIIAKATAPKKADRYPGVMELADDLRRYLRGEETVALPDSLLKKVDRWVQRHRQATAFVVVFSFMLMIGLFGGSWVALIIRNQMIQAQEQQLATLQSRTASQANYIDGQLLKYEGLLGVIAAGSAQMLVSAADEEIQPVMLDDFANGRVPDLETSKRYGLDISLSEPVSLVGRTDLTEEESEAVMTTLRRLRPLQRMFRTVLLRSKSEAAAGFTPTRAKRQIADKGTPISKPTGNVLWVLFLDLQEERFYESLCM